MAGRTVKFSREIAGGLPCLENSHPADKGDYFGMSAVPFIFRGIRKGIGLCWDVFCGEEKTEKPIIMWCIGCSLGFCEYYLSWGAFMIKQILTVAVKLFVLQKHFLCNLYII